jgi:OFA family oxalate/formate antiporter-like MFS transporter
VTIGGRFQDKLGPKKVAMVGGVVYAVSYLIASVSTESIALMYVAYALLGVGVGLGYSCPLAACIKWFPDKKGLVSGIAVAGFGAGTFVFAQVGQYFIDNGGITQGYMALGVIFLVMVLLGAQLLFNPPVGYCPMGWTPPQNRPGAKPVKEYTWREMMRTSSWKLLWVMFILSATSGLMMIGNVGNVSNSLQEIYLVANPGAPAGYKVMVVQQVATVTGILAVFNGAGRIVWGFISDKIGRVNGMKAMFITQAAILFGAAAFMMTKPTDEDMQFVGLTAFVSLVGFCFGGNFALFAPTTSDYFGSKNFGNNYGVVFTAYAVGGVAGGMIPAFIKGGFEWVFIAVAVASLIAFVLAWFVRTPEGAALTAKGDGKKLEQKS